VQAITLAALGALAFLPVPFFIAETWLGGILGGAAAGLLTFPICVALAWLASRRPAWSTPRPDRRGADVALLACALVQIGALVLARDRWDALMIGGIALPPAVLAWIWGAWGWQRAAALSFPVLFGWFALPWEHFLRFLDHPLQSWTAAIAHTFLNLAGWPVRWWDELTIYTYEFYVTVNETCSGMNMLVTLIMYTLIFAWATQPRVLGRVLLCLLVIPVSMFANGIRVAAIYLLGYSGGNDLAMGFWHTGSAYLLFLPVFWFLYVVGNVLARRLKAPKASNSAQTTIHQSPKRV
jgi:exosortase